jgi:hypothetical protein
MPDAPGFPGAVEFSMAEISNSPWQYRCANNLKTKRFAEKVKTVDVQANCPENRSKN